MWKNLVFVTVIEAARCWWRSSLRHRATRRKVAGSIPDGVTAIFHWHNPCGRTMTLGLTQPLTEMSTRNISWGVKAADALRADNLTTFMCRLSWNLGTSTSWNPLVLSRPVMGLLYLLPLPLRLTPIEHLSWSWCFFLMTNRKVHQNYQYN